MSANALRLSRRERRHQDLLDCMEGRSDTVRMRDDLQERRTDELASYPDEHNWSAHSMARSILS